MKRSELEHILRASAGITGADTFFVIGTQALLGQHPNAPAALTQSQDADLFTERGQQDSDLIDGSIGERSPFHETFGYYGHGVGPETAILPEGWRDRVVRVHSPATGGATGLCLEVHDLAASKLAAGREKDADFVSGLLSHGLAQRNVIQERIAHLPVSPERRQAVLDRLSRIA